MCDRCYYRDKVQLPEQDITHHYRTLVDILNRSDVLGWKLTALKLVDAWYHTSGPRYRLETPPPLLDRYIGEQIVAFLIVNGYLKEAGDDKLQNYVTKGSMVVAKDRIRFQGARVLRVPPGSLRTSINNRVALSSPSPSNTEVSSTSNCLGSNGHSVKRKPLEMENSEREVKETFPIVDICESSSDGSSGSNEEAKRRKTGSFERDESTSEREVTIKDERCSNVPQQIDELIAKDLQNCEKKDVLLVPVEDAVIILE